MSEMPNCSPFPRKDGKDHVALGIRLSASAYLNTSPIDYDLVQFLQPFAGLELAGLGRATNNILPNCVKQAFAISCRNFTLVPEPRYHLDGPDRLSKSADLVIGQADRTVLIEIKSDGQYQSLASGLSELKVLTGVGVRRLDVTVCARDVLPVLICVRDSGTSARAWERRLGDLFFSGHDGPRPLCVSLFAGCGKAAMTFNAAGVADLLATIRGWLAPPKP